MGAHDLHPCMELERAALKLSWLHGVHGGCMSAWVAAWSAWWLHEVLGLHGGHVGQEVHVGKLQPTEGVGRPQSGELVLAIGAPCRDSHLGTSADRNRRAKHTWRLDRR
jgi:hypothetical protein